MPMASAAFDVLTIGIDVLLLAGIVGGGILLFRRFGKGDAEE